MDFFLEKNKGTSLWPGGLSKKEREKGEKDRRLTAEKKEKFGAN